MPARHREKTTSRRQESPRRAPPNYLSRRVQWKVFTLVAMFMLVIILMQEARKAENWEWMWQLDKASVDGVPVDEEDIDTRLREPDGSNNHMPGVEALVIAGEDGQIPLPDADQAEFASQKDESPVARSRQDAWSRIIESLSDEDRECFLAGLKSIRDGSGLAQDSRDQWPRIIEHLNRGWKEYLDQAFLAVADEGAQLTDAEKKLWLEVIEQLKLDWREHLHPALLSLSAEQTPDPKTIAALEQMQSALDTVFLGTIKDSTVFRSGEKDAWFRFLERLDRANLPDLESHAVGRVSFLQVYRQPDDYRGKLVTVQGSVRRGYYRQAPRNFYGIPGYYIFWLKPTGSNSPMVVYCLDVPQGFPDVKTLEETTAKPELNEQVEFTGFFFKRWAYRSEDGTRLAPLILAKTPRWEAPAEDSAAVTEPPPWTLIASLAGGSALFGILFATAVYLTSRQSRSPWERRRARGPSQRQATANQSHAADGSPEIDIVTADDA